jgi:hypothetical protein
VLAALDPVSKIDPDWPRLVQLRDLGRCAATAWLAERGVASPSQAPPARTTQGADPLRAAASRI